MEVGEFARYRNTGTVGKVVDTYVEEGVTWVHLDTYDLYYDASTLEPASETDYRDLKQREKDFQAKLEDIEELTSALERIDISRITPSGT